MKKMIISFVSLALVFILNSSYTAHAQGTAFVYQGSLTSSGAPANGTYDFTFTLYTTNLTGVPIAGPVTNSAIAVSNGLFSATIDFGNVFTGESNWLAIAVSTNGANAFTTLAPRQQLLPVPYAITAANLSGVVSSAQLPYIALTNNESAVTLAGNFSGNGSGLYNIPNSALPSNLITNNEYNVYLSGSFSGNGSGLYNISNSALPSNLITNNEYNVYLSGSFSGNGSGLYNIPNSALPSNLITNNEYNVYLAGSFSGNGSGLYNIANSALPSNLITNNEYNVYLSGSFSGNGSGLYNIPNSALPSNLITNNEYNVYLSGNFSGDGSGLYNISPSALPTDVLTNNEYNVNLSGQFSGNGNGLNSLNSANLSGTIPQANLGTNGVYTPTIGNGSSNFTTSTQSGYYALFGNLIYFEAWIKWTGKNGVAINPVVVSLPPGYPVASARAVFSIGWVTGITNSTQILAFSPNGNTTVSLVSLSTNGVAPVSIPVTNCGNTGEIQITGTYRWQ